MNQLSEVNQEKALVLFSPCKVVRGIARSIISDLHREKIFTIPNSLADLLAKHNKKTVREIKKNYAESDHETIDEYVEFLLSHELAFFTDDPGLFLDLDLSWKSPLSITNAIIDSDANSNHDFAFIFKQLDELATESVELRFFSKISLNDLKEIVGSSDGKRIRCLDLIIPFSEELTEAELKTLAYSRPRVSRITIYRAPRTEVRRILFDGCAVFFLGQDFPDESHCGVIRPDSMIPNLAFFTESVNYNNCLNRKIAVDRLGQVKNCPTQTQSYGKYFDLNWRELIHSEEFQRLWKITKDQVDICRICEFRYSCLDCRAFVSNIHDKPAKCDYDPYTMKWSGERGKR